MDDGLKSSLFYACKLLQKCEVKYLLVGGAAVALHGYYRESIKMEGVVATKPDIDVWYEPTYHNYFNLLKFIGMLDYDITELVNEKLPNPMQAFFKLDFNEFTLDLLPAVKMNVSFGDVFKRRETIVIEEIYICFIGYNDLLNDKMQSLRPKDVRDMEALKKIHNKK